MHRYYPDQNEELLPTVQTNLNTLSLLSQFLVKCRLNWQTWEYKYIAKILESQYIQFWSIYVKL